MWRVKQRLATHFYASDGLINWMLYKVAKIFLFCLMVYLSPLQTVVVYIGGLNDSFHPHVSRIMDYYVLVKALDYRLNRCWNDCKRQMNYMKTTGEGIIDILGGEIRDD